ncbi:DUF2341 domain-containing protein [Methanococcus voltae]|uniref:DUF2341 domain-containing protein n=1 Tax=Methanococcus voltae TaxID=2188 RepID=UPI001AE2AB65|nr:DUF2341 domain-containing protein [Methanococcus voltae]MBP2173089.1 hypothetical protein [Methanococcus voltae]
MKLKILLFLTIILFSISFCNAEQCYYHYDSDTEILTFKVPEIPATEEVTYYVNEDVNSANYSNPNEVFEFFDDFSGTNIDYNKWIVSSGINVNDGYMTISDESSWHGIISKQGYRTNTKLIMYLNVISGSYHVGFSDGLGTGDSNGRAYFVNGLVQNWIGEGHAGKSCTIEKNTYAKYTVIRKDNINEYYINDVLKASISDNTYIGYIKPSFASNNGVIQVNTVSLQKYDENVLVSKNLESGKLKVTVTNNNNFDIFNYPVDIDVTQLNPTINSFRISNIKPIDPIETDEGLQIQKDKEVINLGDSLQFSVISNYDIDSYTWDFGDGTTESTTTNIIAHTYAKSDVYTVICKAILTNGDVKYNKIDFIVGTKISNAEIKFLDELTGTSPSNLSINGVLFTNNNYLINISNNTSYNVTYPEYSTITFTSSDGLIRQVETTNLSRYDILLPPANTYVVQYNIISYSDDKIEVKTTDLKTINVGNKDVVAHLIKGKTYNIFVNGNFYKQIIAKDPDTIYINQNANQEIGSIFDNKLSERIEYNIQPNGQYGQYLVVLSNKDKAIGKVIVVTEKNTDTYITYNEINSTFALTQGYNELDASIYRCEENSEILYDIFVNQNYQNYDVAKYTEFLILTKKIYFESYEPPYFTFTFYLVLCFLISAILFVILSASSGNLHLSLLVSSVIFAVVQDIFHIGAIGKISSGLFLSIAILAWVWTVFKRGAENG